MSLGIGDLLSGAAKSVVGGLVSDIAGSIGGDKLKSIVNSAIGDGIDGILKNVLDLSGGVGSIAEKLCAALLPKDLEFVSHIVGAAVDVYTGNLPGAIDEGMKLLEDTPAIYNKLCSTPDSAPCAPLPDASRRSGAVRSGPATTDTNTDHGQRVSHDNSSPNRSGTFGGPDTHHTTTAPPPRSRTISGPDTHHTTTAPPPPRSGAFGPAPQPTTPPRAAPNVAPQTQTNSAAAATGTNQTTSTSTNKPATATSNSNQVSSTPSTSATSSTSASSDTKSKAEIEGEGKKAAKAFLDANKNPEDLMAAIRSGNIPDEVLNSQGGMMMLQQQMNQIQMMNTLMTNMMKSMHDMSMAVASNLRV